MDNGSELMRRCQVCKAPCPSLAETGQYIARCFQCKTLIQKVRNLLEEFNEIKKNETEGVCEFCKRSNPTGKCRRCEYIFSKSICVTEKQQKNKQIRFKSWLSKVHQLFRRILETERICEHKLYSHTDSSTELEKLLQELKSPLEMRQPDITFFPAIESISFTTIECLTQSKDMLEEVITKIKSDSLTLKGRYHEDSLNVSPETATSCVCKYIMEKNFESRQSLDAITDLSKISIEAITSKDMMIKGIKTSSVHKTKRTKNVEVDSANVNLTNNKDRLKGKTSASPSKSKEKKTSEKENITPKRERKFPKEKVGKSKKSSEEAMFQSLLKDKKKAKDKESKSKPQKEKLFKFDPLPEIKNRDSSVTEKAMTDQTASDSVVECYTQFRSHPEEMIKGTEIVAYDRNYKDEEPSEVEPLLFKIQASCPEPETTPIVLVSPTGTTSTTAEKASITKGKPKKEVITDFSGVLQYQLSNREFIDKGWTCLPTTKILRKMNIYKMEPMNPHLNWFKRNQYKKILFYDTGEKLADILSDGRGKWYYRNGNVALDYYSAHEQKAGKRFVVYSSGDESQLGSFDSSRPVTVLACFDYQGNGVVYDLFGDVRLKYNQSEGIVVDPKIGPPSHWKWHTLNDPPDLQHVFVDTYEKSEDTCLEKFLRAQKDDKSSCSSKSTKDANEYMIAIELENFVKAKANKMLQKFKPFQIRTKVVKLNDRFSLRVLDQSNIYLLFSVGQTSLKLNLGMRLISNEIVDVETVEVVDVHTPYSRPIPKTKSVANIQKMVQQARRHKAR